MDESDPYRVLGVDRSWSLPDIEASYREQIVAAHPDRHIHEGPDAVIEADQRTRQLNEAMSQIRERHSMFSVPGQSGVTGAGSRPTPGANRGGWMGTGTNPSDDWTTGDAGDDFGIKFGWSLPDEERRRTHGAAPQPCPLCGEQFDSLNDYTAHMHMVHQRDPAKMTGRRSRRRRQRQVRESRLIPVLQWLGFLVCAVAVFALLGWRASMPPTEADVLTPVLVVAVIAALALAGWLLYSRFFEDRRGQRRVKF